MRSSNTTIYPHAEGRPKTEPEGELGPGFSVYVAPTGEASLYADELPRTRRVVPERPTQAGLEFTRPELEFALRAALGK